MWSGLYKTSYEAFLVLYMHNNAGHIINAGLLFGLSWMIDSNIDNIRLLFRLALVLLL